MTRATAVAAPAISAGRHDLPALGSLGGLLADRRYRTVVLGSSKDPNAKVTVLLLPVEPGTAVPMAVKVPTTGVAAAAVAAEADLLSSLHRQSDDPIIETVPRPLGLVDGDAGPAMAVEILSGVPMATGYHRWHHTARPAAVSADFAAAATWLARFQAATATPARPVTAAGDLRGRLTSRFAGDPGSGAALVAAGERLADIDGRLRGQVVMGCAVHGDYWFGNLLVERAGAAVRGVVDWEAGELAGSPLRDLARFAVSYALYLDRHTRPGSRVAGHRGLRAGQPGAALLFAVESSGWFGGLFRRFLSSGLHRLGIHGISATDLAVMGVAEVAATADHDGFARQHLELLAHMTEPRP